MDPNHILNIFNASFHQDGNVRIKAELELRQLEPTPHFLPTLLMLLSPSSPHPIPRETRLAISIYLKNRVLSSWRAPPQTSPLATPSSSSSIKPFIPIPPPDKDILKSSILHLLAELCSDPQKDSNGSEKVKQQLGAVLAKVVQEDWPERWEGLGREVGGLLVNGSGNTLLREGELEAGLRGCVEIFRGFRYSYLKDLPPTLLPTLLSQLFPTLLSLASQLLSTPTPSPPSYTLQGTLLHLILKSYKNSIMSSLDPSLQERESIRGWGTIFLGIVQRPFERSLALGREVGGGGQEGEDLDEEETNEILELHPWNKSRKWSLFILNRLFHRYGNPSQLPKNFKSLYGSFAGVFEREFVGEVIRVALGGVERRVNGEWWGRKSRHELISFFEECIKPKSTWTLLKPHIEPLISSFIYPELCMTQKEVLLYDEDPQEWSRAHFGDFIEDSYSNPRGTSLNFLTTLVSNRKSSTLLSTLNFIQSVVSKYPNETTPIQKDGALKMLGALAKVATKTKKLAPMMESFFQMHVLPEFKSQYGFMRCRACEIVEQFESCDMGWDQKENLQLMFRAVMDAIMDPDLPVRIQAAIALPELVRYEEVRAGMVPNIGRIMQELLKLANEVDLDALTNTTRVLVGEFSEEVIPFAVELTQQLTESFRRLVQESLEAREKEEQSGAEDTYDEEKTLVSINILKTIDQLVNSLQASPTSLDAVEHIITPALEFTILNSLVELYDEVFEIMDTLTFHQKKISTPMWGLFEATYHTFKKDPDFFVDMSGSLDNVVSFGGDVLSTNTEYRRMLVEMYDSVMTSRALGAEDRVSAAKLAESLLLNLRGNIDEALPPIIQHSMGCLLSDNKDPDFVVNSSLYLHSVELIATAIFYNPALSLALLDGHDWTQQFFAIWFKNLDKFTRVHDRKIFVGAICSLFEWLSTSGATAPLAQNASQLLGGALQVFAGFPAAITARAEQERAFAEYEDDGGSDPEFDDEELGQGLDDHDEGDVYDDSDDYLEQLSRAQAAQDDESDDGSTWSEEILWASPLDLIDSYQRFASTLSSMEATAPALFQLATQPLNPTQRAELEGIAARALRGGEKADLPPPRDTTPTQK